MPELRHRILGCACDMYLSEGLEGFSLRKLARNLGVTAPALYRHYPSREAVLGAVIGEAFKVFGSYLYRGLEGRTPQERLRLTGEGYVAFALEHPRFYEVIHASRDLLGFVDMPEELSAQACSTRQFLVDRVHECMDAGVLRQGNPEQVALTIWAFSHGVVSLYLGGVLPMERDQFPEFFRRTMARLFTGIAGEAFLPRESEQPTVTASR